METLRGVFNIIDSHEHILLNDVFKSEGITEIWEKCDFKSSCLLSAQGIGYVTQNLKCLLFKAKHPQVYAFGGLEHYQFDYSNYTPDYLEQIKRIDSMGFDGVKMIEGKPAVRKALNRRLDDEIFDGFYEYAQENSIPITFHVGDPPNFWNRDTVPNWALQEGWYYGEGGYIPYNQFYEEIEGILKKFPNLILNFAHFFFLSGDIKEARRFLDTYPNICFDLTPGSEMYINFSTDIEVWRQFFRDYQDRIIFGTDKTDEDIVNLTNAELPRKFLETEGSFDLYGIEVQGVGLEKNILQKIYSDNFSRIAGKSPKKIDLEEAREEYLRLKKYIDEVELRDLSYFDRWIYQNKETASRELEQIKGQLHSLNILGHGKNQH